MSERTSCDLFENSLCILNVFSNLPRTNYCCAHQCAGARLVEFAFSSGDRRKRARGGRERASRADEDAARECTDSMRRIHLGINFQISQKLASP